MTENTAAEVFPPGEFIREELEARGWSQQDLAAIMEKSENLVSLLIRGQTTLTAETAVALAGAFNTSPEFWMNLEAMYRIARTPKSEAVARRARLFEKAPVKEMVKRGWIEDSESVAVTEHRVLNFFDAKSLDEDFAFDHAAKKTGSYTNTSPALLAWLFRSRQLAKCVSVDQPWKPSNMPSLIGELSKLMVSPESTGSVWRALSRFGVRLVVVEPIAKSKICGASFWLEPRNPVVAMSLRYDRIDNFWFTLFHELGHIAHNHGTSIDAEVMVKDEKAEEEILANTFASEKLLPRAKLDNWRARKSPLYTRKSVKQFAALLQIHPGIVVGQLQHAEDDHSLFRDLLVRVREHVTPTTLTDGWGSVAPSDL